MFVSILTAVLVLASAGMVHAKGVLTAGPITSHINHSYRCFAANVSEKSVNITLTFFNSSGGQLAAHTCSDVAPGDTCFLDRSDIANYCRIEHDGSKKAVQAVLEVTVDGFEHAEIVPAR